MGFSYSGKLFGGTGSGGVSVSGGVNTQVAYFTGASSLSSDAGLTYDAAGDKLALGSNAHSGDDAAITLKRAATNPIATGGSHAVRDESTYSTSSAGAYASFDSAPSISGVGAHNHLHSFQSRPYFNGENGIGAVRGMTFRLYGTWSGAIGQVAGLYMADSVGTGTITLQAALLVDELTKGTANYAIYSAGAATPSYHAGFFQTGAALTAAGVITGSNLKSDSTVHTVRLGESAGAKGYFNTYIGHLAANSANDSDQKNVCVGTRSGNAITAGASNVFLGYSSGYYETGSSKLMIDNAPRTDEADARTKALIYGIFDAATANQVFTVNAAKVRLPYLPTYADNAAALAGGLVAGDMYRTAVGVLMVTY